MPIASISDFSRDDAGGGDGASGATLPPYGPGGIYHEKQVASMCAVHAVNNMLQGPLFEYSDFYRVAQELDREEARLTGGQGLGDGANARMDGFFNVQVLRAVLQRAGYDMVRADSESGLDPKSDTAKEVAYILNKREHWFSLRRIGREWFDLNSCIKTPHHYNDGDLRFHVGDAIKQGYSVFVVRGNFPKCALEEDAKKLVEAIQGCGRPGQGYSLFAGGGQSLGGGGGGAAAPGSAADAAAARAARLARLEGSSAPAPEAGGAGPFWTEAGAKMLPSDMKEKIGNVAAGQAVTPEQMAGLKELGMDTSPDQLIKQGLWSRDQASARGGGYTAPAAKASPMPASAPAGGGPAAGGAPSAECQQLMGMGFDRAKCEAALAKTKGNMEQAIEALLSG